MKNLVLIIPLLLAPTHSFALGGSTNKKDFSHYQSMMENLNEIIANTHYYKDLPANMRCILEFAWGLNYEEVETYKKLSKNPNLILSDHYKNVIKAGIEVSLNALTATKLIEVNYCKSAFDSKDNTLFENDRKTCSKRLKDGYYGEYNKIDFSNYEQLSTAFTILNSKYMSKLPLDNEQLESLLGSCDRNDT